MVQTNFNNKAIRVLIVDDSWVLHKVLRGTLSQRKDINIIGEATNGIMALELILKEKPDVILLGMEMPIMDGITTLQHLMIHIPTPTIMLSSFSKRGTARCFDALKYGAVDFVAKESIFKAKDGAAHSRVVLRTIRNASRMKVREIDPMQQGETNHCLPESHDEIIFCEECGTRQLVEEVPQDGLKKCKKCGEELLVHRAKRFRRMDYITVIGAGVSGYANILKIIPKLAPEMGGALCVVILDRHECVESFAKYLDSICDFDVIFGQNGMSIDGGGCYLFSEEQRVRFSPYSGHYKVHINAVDAGEPIRAIDILMTSAVSCMKNRTTGVLLSGESSDGSKGLKKILQENGRCFVLSPDYCLHKAMVDGPMEKFNLNADNDETSLAAAIQTCHFANKEKVITA